MAAPLSILCIASYHKGQAFLREAKRQGARVYLVTSESLRDADWPRDSLDDIFFVKPMVLRRIRSFGGELRDRWSGPAAPCA